MADNSAYGSSYVEDCVRRGHHFKIVGSDAKPLKRSLACITCSEATGKSAYCAYGDDTKSFGQWRQSTKREKETFNDEPGYGTV